MHTLILVSNVLLLLRASSTPTKWRNDPIFVISQKTICNVQCTSLVVPYLSRIVSTVQLAVLSPVPVPIQYMNLHWSFLPSPRSPHVTFFSPPPPSCGTAVLTLLLFGRPPPPPLAPMDRIAITSNGDVAKGRIIVVWCGEWPSRSCWH